jgi:hypothetical protein
MRPPTHLTRAQHHALERIVRLGHLHFSRVATGCSIRPRLWPLLVGPTGSGKSFIAREAAHQLDAVYKRVSYGDWVVQGSRQVSTCYTIIHEALTFPRLLLHIDELDKLPVGNVEDWSRAVGTEVWGLLDGELPIRRFLGDPELKLSKEESLALASGGLMEKLFIVGSGTWQLHFDAAKTPRSLGFGGGDSSPKDAGAHVVSSLESVRGVASELLARFDGTLLFLEPPDIDEALQILHHVGALDYARQHARDPRAQLERLLPRQGFRALESVLTELLLHGWVPQQRRSGEPQPQF